MINIVIFITISFFIVFLFLSFLIYLSRRTSQKDKQIYKELADKLNFSFYDTDTIGFQEKVKGMLDFGKSSEPIKNIVVGEFDKNNVYIFERDDKPFRTGLKSFATPTWAVFLLELNNCDIDIKDFILYHKNTVFFSKMKQYKTSENDWKEINLKNFPNKDYRLYTGDQDYLEEKINSELNSLITECINRFKKTVTPRWITIQKRGNYFAAYADGAYFDNVEEMMLCFEYTKNIFNKIKSNSK